MAEIRTIQSTMNGGELSPLVAGQVGTQRYFNGMQISENWVPMVPGGTRVRGGLKYAGAAKYSNRKAYLVPFVFSQTTAYMLEFGHLYIRFWKYDADGEPTQVMLAGVPYEVVSGYTEDEVALIECKQSADVLFIDHPAHPPATLSRLAETHWVLQDITFIPPPTYEAHLTLAATLSASAATGQNVTFTASAPVFLPGDVGRDIGNIDAGEAIIGTYVSPTQVIGDIVAGTFLTGGPTYASGDWWLTGSPNAVLQVYIGGPVGAKTTVYTYTDTDGVTNLDCFRTSDVGKYIVVLDGVLKIFGYFDAHTVFVQIVTRLTKFPVPQQVAVIDQATLTVTLKTPQSVPDFVPGGLWTVESPTWTADRGYPGALTFGQQRVFHGGARSEPDTIRATPTGDYYGFNPGTEDDRALNFTIPSEEVNIVQWLTFWRGLVVGTLGGGFHVTGATGGIAPITPKAPLVTPGSSVGSEKMDAVRVGTSLLYVERGGRKAREIGYNVAADGYVPKDLSAWADHIGETYILRGMVYQQSIYPIVWFPRCDGTFVSLTYEASHQVEGWARQVTSTDAGQSYVLSMGVMPNAKRAVDDLWLLIQRTINGSSTYYVEVLDWEWFLDASVRYSGVATETLTGLSHLEGENVWIRGEGQDGVWRLYPRQTVAGGQVIGLDPAVVAAEVGTYTAATTTTMRLEMPGGSTLQGRRKGFGNITVRMKNTPTLTWGGVRYKRNRGEAVVSGYDPTQVYIIPTGENMIATATLERDVELIQQAYDTEGRVSFVQDLPLGGWLLMWTADVAVGR